MSKKERRRHYNKSRRPSKDAIQTIPRLSQLLPAPLLETVRFLTSSRAGCRLARLQKPRHYLELDQLS